MAKKIKAGIDQAKNTLMLISGFIELVARLSSKIKTKTGKIVFWVISLVSVAVFVCLQIFNISIL
jgi:hypothetical protein